MKVGGYSVKCQSGQSIEWQNLHWRKQDVKIATLLSRPQEPYEHYTYTRPDDWHLHLATAAALVVPDSAAHFGRGLIMLTLCRRCHGADATAYRERIMDALPDSHAFTYDDPVSDRNN